MLNHIKYIEEEIDNLRFDESKKQLTQSLFIIQGILAFCYNTQILNYEQILNLNNKAYEEYEKNINRLEKGF